MLESLPGIFVEHDDDFVASCLPQPTPFNPNSAPLDEASALERVKQILDGREQIDEKSSSDKENDSRDETKVGDVSKTYSKKNSSKQKVLAAKNGSVTIKSEPASSTDTENVETSTMTISGDTSTVNVKKDVSAEDVEMTEQKFAPSELLPWGACLADQVLCDSWFCLTSLQMQKS
jgi:hypothetical protein